MTYNALIRKEDRSCFFGLGPLTTLSKVLYHIPEVGSTLVMNHESFRVKSVQVNDDFSLYITCTPSEADSTKEVYQECFGVPCPMTHETWKRLRNHSK